MQLEKFELPSRGNGVGGVPGMFQKMYQWGKFEPALRNWHIGRLPRYEVNVAGQIRCAYCGKSKGARSMEVDHVIPVRVYCRWVAFKKHDPDGDLPTDHQMGRRVKSATNDMDNLVLSCRSCNGTKKDKILTQNEYDQIINGINPKTNENTSKPSDNIKNKFLLLKQWTQEICRYPFYMQGLKINIRKKDTIEKIIQASIINYFSYNRPDWNDRPEMVRQLRSDQNFSGGDVHNGRLCIYCFGLFHKQAFDIDHIIPKVTFKINDIKRFNDPQNLIPVCRTCNRVKSSIMFSKEGFCDWLDNQILKRKAEGLPGYEHTSDFLTDEDDDDELEVAKFYRAGIFQRGGYL